MGSLSRRDFVAGSAIAVAGFALGCSRRGDATPVPVPATPAGPAAKVAIAIFSDDGRKLRIERLDKVVRTDAEWRRQLGPLSYDVARRAGTERPFTGPLLGEHRKGVFRCLCCDTALFDAATKFESGTGWPSFWQPIAPGNVAESRDLTFGMIRTAVSCARCDAHLGHVFDDGPRDRGGLRYCINSAALRFVPRERMQAEGYGAYLDQVEDAR